MRPVMSAFLKRLSVPSGETRRVVESGGEHMRLPAGFEAVAEALASGECPIAACAEVGRTLAHDGVSLGEVLAGLRQTYAARGGAAPGFDATEAASVAWSEATLEFLHEVSCDDPLTGLSTLAHLRARLAEHYRESELLGEPVGRTRALLVVDVDLPPARLAGAPFTRALRMARIADTLRAVYPGEETIAKAAASRVVVLVRRDAGLHETVEVARCLLDEQGCSTRVWVEGLPDDAASAVHALSEVARG